MAVLNTDLIREFIRVSTFFPENAAIVSKHVNPLLKLNIMKGYILHHAMITNDNIKEFLDLYYDTIVTDIMFRYLCDNFMIPMDYLFTEKLIHDYKSFRLICDKYSESYRRKFIIKAVMNCSYMYKIALYNFNTCEYIIMYCYDYNLNIYSCVKDMLFSYRCNFYPHITVILHKYENLYIYNNSLRSTWIKACIMA